MASKKNEKAEKRNKQQFEEEKASVERFREIAPRMKKSLKGIGCDLPFYDYLDSYDLEFHRIANEALESIPSLLAVEEFDAENSGDSENPREYKGFRQVFFELDSRFNNYTKRSPGSNVCGSATFMLNSSCELGTLIQVPRNIKCSFRHPEFKYVLKIGALLHEIGHAWDAENRLNIDPTTGRFGVVKSELFAHCYALDRLAERCLAQTYNMYIEAMKRQSFLGGFESEIASEVLKEHAIRSLVKWQDHIDHAMEYEKSLVQVAMGRSGSNTDLSVRVVRQQELIGVEGRRLLGRMRQRKNCRTKMQNLYLS